MIGSKLFRSVSETDRRELIRGADEEYWSRGSQVAEGSATQDSFFLILSGRIRVWRAHPTRPRQITLYLLGPGDGFDVLSLLDGQLHEVERRALEPSRAIVLRREAVRDVFDRDAVVRQDILEYLSSRVKQLEELAEDLALHDTSTRLARLILRHTDPKDAGNGAHLSGLSDATIASMIGSVRVVVNRQLQELRREGIVESDGSVVVRDLEALASRCERRLSAGNHKSPPAPGVT